MILDKERKTASRCVIVLEHPIDWCHAYELFGKVRSRVESTGDRLDRGCWFFLPGFTVFAADPSQEFFACVDRCVRRWRGEIKLCSLHGAGVDPSEGRKVTPRIRIESGPEPGTGQVTDARRAHPPGGPVHRRLPGLNQDRPDEGHSDPRRR